MNQQRFPEEFKVEAAKQVLEHGHSVADVSRRLGVSTHSLYKWIKSSKCLRRGAPYRLTKARNYVVWRPSSNGSPKSVTS